MLLSYLQGCWRNGQQSHAVGRKKIHVFELRKPGHQSHAADTFQLIKSMWVNILEYWICWYWFWPSLIELSNFGRT